MYPAIFGVFAQLRLRKARLDVDARGEASLLRWQIISF